MSKAIIIIDVQKYFLNKHNKTRLIVKKIQKYLKNNLQKYNSVYFTIYKNDQNSPNWLLNDWKDCVDSPDIDLADELKEFTNKNNLFYKNNYSAYKIHEIKKGIENNKIKEVHLCGFDTDCCVLATAYDLFDVEIKPVVLENLTWSISKEKLHKHALKIINRNIGFVEKV